MNNELLINKLLDYVKELELQVIVNGLQLPTMREDLPTRLYRNDSDE